MIPSSFSMHNLPAAGTESLLPSLEELHGSYPNSPSFYSDSQVEAVLSSRMQKDRVSSIINHIQKQGGGVYETGVGGINITDLAQNNPLCT